MCSAYVQTFDRSGGLIPSRRSRRKYGRVATDWDGTTWLMDAPQQKIQASSQATTRLVSIPNKVDGSYDETFSGERADVRERSAGDPPMRSGERTVRYRPMGYQDRHHIGPGVHSSCAGQPSTDRRQGKSCLTGPPCPSCPTCWDNSLCPPRPRDQGVTAEETVLKAQVRGKENMLLRDRNDLNSDPDDSTASRPGSLQFPGASVLAQNDRGASGRSGIPGPVPSGTPSARRRGPDQGCEASVDRWGSGSKIRVSVSVLD